MKKLHGSTIIAAAFAFLAATARVLVSLGRVCKIGGFSITICPPLERRNQRWCASPNQRRNGAVSTTALKPGFCQTIGGNKDIDKVAH